MEREDAKQELSYFELTLLDFLRQNHPDMVHDKEFIENRANQAAEAYETSIRQNGDDHVKAIEISNDILFRSLYFSKHRFIVNILIEEFEQEIAGRDDVREIAIKLQPELEEIFGKYEIDNHDFDSGPSYDSLYTEIVGAIVIYQEENGIL